MVADLSGVICRTVGGEPASREQLLAAPVRYPRPSKLDQPLPVGPKTREAAERLGLYTLGDLIEHTPVTQEFRDAKQIRAVRPGEEATIDVVVKSISLRPTRRRNLRIVEAAVADDSGGIKAVWFNQAWLAKQLEPGTHLRLFGRRKGASFNVREHAVVQGAGAAHDDASVSIYPGTEGFKSTRIREVVAGVRGLELETIEVIPGRLRARQRLTARCDALADMHFPRDPESTDIARERLAFEELLKQQLALSLRRLRRSSGLRSRELAPLETVVARWRERLPFTLTDGQQDAIAAIDRDLARSVPMQRLLMGEVGSGKTAVALCAMLRAAENGAQAALMAPTEILAEQHFATLDALLPDVPLALLTGSTPAARRREILARLASGELPLIVGTHALIEDAVDFRDLALAVVDEQHRFGVRQRAALDAKAPSGMLPHVLHMTATPIPRTLALAAYGDLDVTQIRELPRGRRPIATRVYGDEQRAVAYDEVRGQLAAGRQAYVVCPLVTESEVLQVRAATDEAERLAKGEFKDFSVGMVHGQLAPAAKAAAMKDFASGKTDVLVATSVVEVGIDVPNATVMLIEDADRYGISQLHQLRGRVGRGEYDSICLLLGSPASRRLRAVAGERDGFKLAQIDLELRGAGEELGTRQSGLPRFKVAALPEDTPLLERASDQARRLLDHDPELGAPEHVLLRDAVTAAYGSEIDPIPA